MRRQKGLCIEMNGESSIFLGQNGEFVQGKPAGKIAVGEQGYYYPMQAAGAKKKWSVKPVWAPVIAAMAVAVLFLSVLLPEPEAFAYVQVQVNPGVELGIDEAYNVVSIRNLNEDGRELIEELGEWKHKSLETVLDDVIDLSVADSTKEITITTVADDEDQIMDEEVTESVLAISSKVLKENITVKLKEATKKQWRTSVEKRVPVGQLIERSEKVETEEKKEKTNDDNSKPPLNVQEKPHKKNQGNEKEVQKETEKEPKPKENKPEDENIPGGKEKPTPPGQEKRKETPANDKGKQNPPGQEKRNQVPGQDKKAQPSDSKKPSPNKGKETAPGQQKKQENKGNKDSTKPKDKGNSSKAKDQGNSSKAKEKKENKGPAHSGRQNSNGKQNGND